MVPAQQVSAVITAYSWAISKTFYIATGFAVAATLLSLGFGSVQAVKKRDSKSKENASG